MEPLSSFGISLAAGYAIELIKYVGKPTVLTQIKRAFELALKEYSPHSQIRETERKKLKGIIQILKDSPSMEISEETAVLDGTARFFLLFEQHLAGQAQAYAFIKGVKDEDSFKLILSSINDVRDEMLEQFNKLQSSSPELEREYTRQLDQYKSNLENFRPITALENIVALEAGFTRYNFTPNNAIKSNIEYLKARCMAFDSKKKDDKNKAFIRAYKLDSSLLKVKESACLSYFQIGERNSAENIVEEILQIDEFNSVAWSIKVILNTESSLRNALSVVPKIVFGDNNFKRIVFLQTRLESKHDDLQEAYDDYGIWINVDYFDGSSTNYQNFQERLFLIESSLTLFSRDMFISYDELNADSEILNKLIALLDNFIEALKDSEIAGNFEGVRFYRFYIQYILEKNPQAVHKMKEHFGKIDGQDSMKLLLLTNALQIIDELDMAIDVINSQEKKSLESLSLEMICWSRKEDAEKVANTAREFLASINSVKQHNMEHLFIVAETLNSFDKLSEFDINEFTNNKEFEKDYIRILVQEFVKVLKDEVDDNTLQNLQNAFEETEVENTRCRNYLALIYHLMNEHTLAVKVYETFISKGEESRELFKYIVSLYHTKERRADVLNLLEQWRKNFSFQPQLLKIELQFRIGLFDFDSSLEVCKSYLDKDESDDYILANYSVVIDSIENIDNKEMERLVKLSHDRDFEGFIYANHVAEVLIKKGYRVEGLEILFREAIKGDPNAKQAYFMATTKMPENTLENYSEVTINSYVEYKVGNVIKTIQIKEDIEKFDQLIGKKVGEEVSISGKFGSKNNLTILRVMNQYMWLFTEITKEANSDPLSDLPMESFNMDDYMGEGKSIIDFLKEITGNQDYDRDAVIAEYYEGKLSFTDITGKEYTSNYVRAFFDLEFEQKGIVEIPATDYKIRPLNYYDYFILDFTSLLRLFQLTKNGIIQPKVKFRLARGNRYKIRSLEFEGLILKGKEYTVDKQFYSDLINWIDEHCDLTVSVSKLDILAKAPEDFKSDPMINYFYDNVSLLMDSEKSLLVTDDTQYTRVFSTASGRLASSRLFIYQCAIFGLIQVNTK